MYSVVIFPSKTIQDKANNYRKRYDSQFAFIPPHVKLVESFKWDEKKLPDLNKVLKEVAEDHVPFTILFHNVRSFAPTNNVIYFGIQNKSDIILLHKAIMQKIPDLPEQFAYVPHLTIGQDLTKDELDDIYGRLQLIDINMKTNVEKIHLLQRTKQGNWEVMETFPLGG